MRFKNHWVLIAGLLLIIGAGVGSYIQADTSVAHWDVENDNLIGNRMQSDLWEDGNRPPMMGIYNIGSIDETGEKLSIEALENRVEVYLSNYDLDLSISDIFVFEDTEYYFSIIEDETGKGAMELLANPYTGQIFYEYGPNMMWNLKYGMHGSNGMGFSRGHMAYNNHYNGSTAYDAHEITYDQAYEYGMNYLEDSGDYSLGDTYHEFYGYYTFHLEEDGQIIGMLSVNAFTGEVWYHDWHGTLVEVIDYHQEADH